MTYEGIQFENRFSFYEDIDKLFHDWKYDHPRILASFVRALKPEVVVEIGTYRGYCACWMAKALQENGKGRLYCIDNFTLKEHVERYGDPRAHLESNLTTMGVRDTIEILEGNSDEVQWPANIDMIYIDGWHSYEAVKHDFFKAVSLGASFIALDDTENCVGPRLFVEEMRTSPQWEILNIHSDNGLTIFQSKQIRRPVCFSQELPLPNPGVDLRSLTLAEQAEHFAEATKITHKNYSTIMRSTEHA